jgi:hypothetical protein
MYRAKRAGGMRATQWSPEDGEATVDVPLSETAQDPLRRAHSDSLPT